MIFIIFIKAVQASRWGALWLRVGILTLLACAITGNPAWPAGALEPTFTKIVDSFTPVPGGQGFFGTFKGELGRNGEAVFLGSPLGIGKFGIYRGSGGPVSVILDETTVMPHSLEKFSRFSEPISSRDGRVLAALGADLAGAVLNGIYEIEGGTFQPLVDFTTHRPEGGLFGDVALFDTLSISGANFAFIAGTRQGPALYLDVGGDLRLIANQSTTIPGRTTPFRGFPGLALEGETAAFVGIINSEFIPIPVSIRPGFRVTSGLYKSQGGALTTVVDNTTAVPNSGERFQNGAFDATIVDGRIFFHGVGDPGGAEGIYVHDSTGLSVIADRTTPVPGGTGTFVNFGFPKAGPSGVVFAAQGSGGEEGIYWHDGTTLRVVADTTTPVPGGTGTFQGFSIDTDRDVISPQFLTRDGTIIFAGTGASGQHGIYADFRGNLHKIIDGTDHLDGRKLFKILLESNQIVEHAFLVQADFDVLFPSALFRIDFGTETRAAVLPSSRSVQAGSPATAFATLINPGPRTAVGCKIAPPSSVAANFVFQTTHPTTNQVTGTPNTPVDIAAGASQSFVFALTPTGPVAPTDVQLRFDCANSDLAPMQSGLNTLFFSASATPIPDIVALAATLHNDGIVNIPGTTGAGVFAVATVNVGADGVITASADTGEARLPVSLALCETNPRGACLAPPSGSVTTQINANATPTFGIFVLGSGSVPFDPAQHRIRVRFTDAGGVVRGATSVAVQTQ